MSIVIDQKKCIALALAKKNEEDILDDLSRMVLRLKNYADLSTLEFFFELLHPHLEKGLPIVSVPSSTAGKTNSGITRLAKMLSKSGCGRIDATSCLVRTVSVKPNHMRGERSIAKHINSIKVVDRHLIQAQQQEFFLEAVTLEESIITDRLICYLVITGALERAKEIHQYPSFGQLIKTWKVRHGAPISIRVKSTEFEDLQSSVDLWRQGRNKIVHGMVKSHPGTATPNIVNFLEEAKVTATEGELLARAVSSWVKKVNT